MRSLLVLLPFLSAYRVVRGSLLRLLITETRALWVDVFLVAISGLERARVPLLLPSTIRGIADIDQPGAWLCQECGDMLRGVWFAIPDGFKCSYAHLFFSIKKASKRTA